MDLVPSLSYCFSVPPVTFHDVSTTACRWRLHELPAVQFDPANILIPGPDVDMGWFEIVLLCVHDKPELPFNCDRWHPVFLDRSTDLSLLFTMYYKRYIVKGDVERVH